MKATTRAGDWTPSARATLLLLAGIIAVGGAIRVAHFWAISGTAFLKITFISPNSDPYAFWHWAQRILAGAWGAGGEA